MKQAMKKDNIEIEFIKWQQSVGKLIFYFGYIELTTYKCLEILPSEYIFDAVVDLSFAKRIDLIIDILKSKSLSAEYKNNFINKLNKAKELAKIRNQLAHEPAQIAVYEHIITGNIHLRAELRSLRKKNGKVLTLQDVDNYAEQVKLLAEDLQNIMGHSSKDAS